MEHPVAAPADGVVTHLYAEVGRQVETGAVLAVVSEHATDNLSEGNSHAS